MAAPTYRSDSIRAGYYCYNTDATEIFWVVIATGGGCLDWKYFSGISVVTMVAEAYKEKWLFFP